MRTRTASSAPAMVVGQGTKPAIDANERLRSCQRVKLAGDTWLRGFPLRGLRSQSAISREGSWKGSRRSRAASTRLKMAALAPIPMARVSSATAV